MVERGIADPSVAGSNPVVPCFAVSVVLWCNWLALWTLNPAIRVQIPVGPFAAHRGDRSSRLRYSTPKRVILVGVVGNISACHADARGSIPRRGAFLVASRLEGLAKPSLMRCLPSEMCAFSLVVMISRCQRDGPGSIPGRRTIFGAWRSCYSFVPGRGCPTCNRLTVAQLVERGTVMFHTRISLGRWFESVR